MDTDAQMAAAPSAPSPDKDADGLCDETEQEGDPLEGPMRPESHFYAYLLDACEKVFEGEMDQSTFEENMRFLFGTKVSRAVDLV
jgi:paired amphipathic helix protein Sin3a